MYLTRKEVKKIKEAKTKKEAIKVFKKAQRKQETILTLTIGIATLITFVGGIMYALNGYSF